MVSDLRRMPECMPIDWLMDGELFIKYRVLIDLQGRPETDKAVQGVKHSIPKHRLIKRIFERQNDNGYWGIPKDIYTWWPKKDTTFWVLGVLADLGLRKNTKEISLAGEYVLSTQLDCGAFGWGPPPTPGECFTGILAESLAKLGYSNDPRLGKTYEWLINRQRVDGGFWCKNSGQPGRPRELEPSCALGTLCVLGALSQSPELKKSHIAKRSIEFLLKCWDNRDKIKYAGHDSQIGKGWEKLMYPFTNYRILKYLDIISLFDSAKVDPRISEMLDILISKRDKNGCFNAESIHKVWSNFDFGQKELPSRWITVIVYRILKRIAER
jgi:hypothetical protein